MAITDRKAKSLKPTDDALAHGGVVGLVLLPLKTAGHGQWRLRYVSPVTGKRRVMTLGSYPAVSIADAGLAGAAAREQISKGIDPLERRRAEERESANTTAQMTFEDAARAKHQALLTGWRNTKHGQQWIGTLEMYAFPTLGSLPLQSIKPAHVADALKPIWLEKPETASRTKQRIHATFTWARAHGLIDSNPADYVLDLLPKQPAKRQRTINQPAMPVLHLPIFWRDVLRDYPYGECTRPLLMFIILTASRSGEARQMLWSEIDFSAEIWRVPATRMKSGLLHEVPLSRQALAILDGQRGLHEEIVFPSPRGLIPSDMVLTSFLRRHEAPSDQPDRPATAHGMRATFRNWASKQRYDRDLAEMALAHAIKDPTEGAYNRDRLLELRRGMMQAWSDYCTSATL